MKKCSKFASLLAMLLIALGSVACKQEPEYVDKIVEKTYVYAVEFSSKATENGVSVSMTTKTEGATIRYTTDETEPTKESTAYTSALEFEKDAIIKAIAVKDGMENSPVSYAKVSIKEKTITETKTEYIEKNDTTAPDSVMLGENSAIAGDAKVLLSWTNPADEDFYGTRISFAPEVENVSNPIVVEGKASASSSALIEGLSNGTEYTFSLVALDKSQNASKSVEVKASPIDSSDKTAPAKVTNLTAENLDGAVLLTWTDPSDSDLFGIEITYTENTNTQSRAIIAMEEGSVFIAPKTQRAKITNLTNGTEYTFTVKTMDTSGNKSDGVTAKATPKAVDASETLKIALSAAVPTSNAYTTNYTGNKSNTTVTVTANIKTASTVKKVVYKKDGSINAKTLLADTKAKDATKGSSDDKKWTFVISATDETANGTYTVAAIDEAGREETEQIKIDQFDFTAPAKVTNIKGTYANSTIILNWTNPTDTDFDKIEITYTSSDDGSSYSTPSEPVPVLKGTEEKTFNGIDGTKAYYKFSFVSIDELGNKSGARTYAVVVDREAIKVLDGFVLVDGKTFTGTETWTPSSKVFVSGRAITIRDLLVCDHEVTQKEYETYCTYGFFLPSDTYGKGDDFPAYYVNWYDAIVYCNLRSIAEGLTPVYKLNDITNPADWNGIVTENRKYCGPSSYNSDWYAITMDITANGYRLPTEAEWEYLARGGKTTSTTYSGSDNIDEVAWYSSNSEKKTHAVKDKTPNALGLYDMSGNVEEWCWDWYGSTITSSTLETGAASGSDRCRCGGDRSISASGCSVSSRGAINKPYSRSNNNGFRVVRTAKAN